MTNTFGLVVRSIGFTKGFTASFTALRNRVWNAVHHQESVS